MHLFFDVAFLILYLIKFQEAALFKPGHRKSIVMEDMDLVPKTVPPKTPDQAKIVQLSYALQDNILKTWPYKNYISETSDLMLDQGLINRAKINTGSSLRLSNFFKRAMEGRSVTTAFISSSVSRLFAKDGSSRKWIYPNSLRLWWNSVVQPVTGSKMYLRDASAQGLGSDYFSRCLKSHIPDQLNIHLILWELSGSDYKRNGRLEGTEAQEMEKLLRNALEYKTHPEVIMLNMFKGSKTNESSYCRLLNEDGEGKLAKHYDCSFLSWGKSICPYLQDDQEGFAYSYLFARDHVHPSIVGHAQMTYILIDLIRDQFLKYLEKPRMEGRSLPLPRPMYVALDSKPPLCYTTVKTAGGQQPVNNLPVIVLDPKELDEAMTRSKIIGKRIRPLHYRIPPIILKFRIPFWKRFTALGVLPGFQNSAKTVARIDNNSFLHVDTRPVSRGKIQYLPARSLRPGLHMLRVWSLDKRFHIIAMTLE